MEHTVNDSLQGPEKVLLVAVSTRKEPVLEEHLNELAALAETAGGVVVERIVQNLPHPERGSYLGSGKIEELISLIPELDIDLVVANASLSPAQIARLSELLPCPVIDRSQLILDIFAKRALSREGKLQVELAQLTYLLPRLAGQTQHLSRLGGGIGTRGPGETKLEVNRRHLRERIAALREEIDDLKRQRMVQRQGRKREGLPQAALIGYTNAGKSTLMNRLCNADVLVMDQLFATLDTTTRRMMLADGRFALLSDTVGFIRQLPTHLVTAFRATLEELQDADILLHVVDISSEQFAEHMEAVQKILEDLDNDRPLLLVLNKCDSAELSVVNRVMHEYPGSVAISATEDLGIDTLISRLQELLYTGITRYTVLIPYAESRLMDPIYAKARIIRRYEGEQGTMLELESDAILAKRLEAYLLPEEDIQWQHITE